MLKSRWFVAILCLVAGLFAGGWINAMIRGVWIDSAKAKAIGVVEIQQMAWNNGDLGGFLSHYDMTDDITFYGDDKVSKGWVGLNDRYRKRYSDAASMGQLAFSDLNYDVLAADAVMVRGRWTTTGTPNAGTGLFTILIRQTSNGWKVVHDHTSAKKKE